MSPDEGLYDSSKQAWHCASNASTPHPKRKFNDIDPINFTDSDSTLLSSRVSSSKCESGNSKLSDQSVSDTSLSRRSSGGDSIFDTDYQQDTLVIPVEASQTRTAMSLSLVANDRRDDSSMYMDQSTIVYDLTSCGQSLVSCMASLDALRENIESRLTAVRVKVSPDIIVDVADQIASRWSYYCETSLDHLLFKAPQSGDKGLLSVRLASQLDAWGGPDAYTTVDMILNVGSVRRAPDLAFWRQKPSRSERLHPLAERCPLPQLWIEICYYDDAADFDRAVIKVRDCIIPVNGHICTILVVYISCNVGDEASQERVGYHSPIGATAAAPACGVAMPPGVPCVAYWPAATAFQNMQWYRIHRNHHLDIVVPNERDPFCFDMNVVIEVIY